MPDNVQILRDIDEAQMRGDFDAFLSYFTDDVKVHAGGNNKLAGDYQGKEQFQEIFGRFMEAAGEDYSFESHAYFADDEHGVALQTSHYKRGGETLDSREVFVTHFRDGKVHEMWFLPQDSAAFDAWIGR
jgi:ketosteroid isomerase-like protein